MRTVSLIYTYGLKNSGDMAINLGAFDLLLDLNCQIKAFSKSDETDKEFKISQEYIYEYYPNIEFYGGPFEYNRDESKINSLINHLKGYFKTIGVNEDKQFIKDFTSSDIIFFNGGNLLRSESLVDYARLKALMYPLEKAREKNIPYIMLPHSASTINKMGHKLLSSNLIKAKKIFTREDKSYSYLEQEFGSLEMQRSIDLAFFIKDNEKASENYRKKYHEIIKSQSYKIAITLRTQVVGDLGELNSNKKKKIMDAIRKTIEHYLKMENHQILLVVQTRKDKEVTVELYNEYKSSGAITLIEEYDTLVLREIYRNCNLLIGMRLHSIILALSANTPAIGYFEKNWGFKNPGLMEKFELPYRLVEEEISDLVKESNSVIKEESKHKDRIKHIIAEENEKIKLTLKSILSSDC